MGQLLARWERQMFVSNSLRHIPGLPSQWLRKPSHQAHHLQNFASQFFVSQNGRAHREGGLLLDAVVMNTQRFPQEFVARQGKSGSLPIYGSN